MKTNMKYFGIIAVCAVLSVGMFVPSNSVDAACSYTGYINSGGKCAKSFKQDDRGFHYTSYRSRYIEARNDSLDAYIEHLLELIKRLQEQRDGVYFVENDEPTATTFSATNIEDDSAELRGSIDMNDFKNGVVFFVYGEDEEQVEDVARDYNSYRDVKEDGDDLQKVRVDTDLDDRESYREAIDGLDDNTRNYFTICVEYEDADDEQTLECGTVREFRTND